MKRQIVRNPVAELTETAATLRQSPTRDSFDAPPRVPNRQCQMMTEGGCLTVKTVMSSFFTSPVSMAPEA
jgi:hypothetical protein